MCCNKRKKQTGDGADGVTSINLTGLANSISGLDREVPNEVILEVATSEERLSDPTIRKLKLEVVAYQNELIRDPRLRLLSRLQRVRVQTLLLVQNPRLSPKLVL